MNKETLEAVRNVRLQEFSARALELDALEQQFGPSVSDVVLKTRAERIKKEWREIGQSQPRNDNQGLLDTLWKWVGESGFEYSYENTAHTLQMRVSKCPLADMARSIGQQEWGFKCYCCDDSSITAGFNDSIKFSRTKTLMQGHDCCDHRYEEQSGPTQP